MLRGINTIAIPPGTTVKEMLIDRGMSQKEFAIRMDMSEKHISHLINGTINLTPEMAYRLEMVLGAPASFWNNLEAIYRHDLIVAKDELSMKADTALLPHFPYKEMSDYNWVPKTTDKNEKVFNLRKFFEVVNLELINQDKLMPIAWRKLGKNEDSDYKLLAWTQQARIEARKVEVSSISVNKLKKIIPEIRNLIISTGSDTRKKMVDLFATCGIALVFLPHLSGSFLHGATFYDKKKIVMGITTRSKDADIFWFSLFHEIGHIILGHIGSNTPLTEEEEHDANSFSANKLIPEEKYATFSSKKFISRNDIIAFAKDVGTHPGIVVGRLQKNDVIRYNQFNDMKEDITTILCG